MICSDLRTRVVRYEYPKSYEYDKYLYEYGCIVPCGTRTRTLYSVIFDLRTVREVRVFHRHRWVASWSAGNLGSRSCFDGTKTSQNRLDEHIVSHTEVVAEVSAVVKKVTAKLYTSP